MKPILDITLAYCSKELFDYFRMKSMTLGIESDDLVRLDDFFAGGETEQGEAS